MATMPREAWTDKRLDDLKEGMHREFDQVHEEIRETNRRLDALGARFDALNRTLTLVGGSIVATLLGAILAKGLF